MREQAGLKRWRVFIELIDTLLREEDVQELASESYCLSPRVASSDPIDRACRFICEHYAESIAHADMARSVGLAPAYFNRLFRRNTRKTFSAYLSGVRLGQASRMLVQSDASVTEIAFACGFHKLSNFNRRFREAYGCPPRN
ncbi:MAG: helix-turn-helix domain-containing protein [Verrucomicrobia bacterium]|jgi:AraC-like DNA-binding protein|nr:helix-turn-helix domain-containing protein [Verrucomicrobiota bacterium]